MSVFTVLADKPAPKGWPAEVRTIMYQASIDKTQQPMLMVAPIKKKKRPLLVGLHTWSGISFVLASGIAGELGDPAHLPSADSLSAYAGIVPAVE